MRKRATAKTKILIGLPEMDRDGVVGKNLGAYGDGGMVTTSDPTVVERTSWLRNYGECAKYEHVMKGVNWNEERLRHASAYAAALEGVGDLVLQERSESSTHVYHLCSSSRRHSGTRYAAI